VFIGIVTQAEGGSSARVATELAAALGRCRTDRVTLVDGAPERAGVTRLMAGHRDPRCTIGSVADGTFSLDPRFGNRAVATVGVDLATASNPTKDEYRRVLDLLRRQSGIVIVDCGSAQSAGLDDLCEQFVLVTDRAVEPSLADAFAGRPTVVVASANGATLDDTTMDRSFPSADAALGEWAGPAALELAAPLTDRWASLGATSGS
jgi:hypothetical protein